MPISGATAVRLQAALCSTEAAKELIDVINAGAGPPSEPGSAIPVPAFDATTGELPTSDGGTTIADAAAPSAAELLDAVVELRVTIASLVATLQDHGLIASA